MPPCRWPHRETGAVEGSSLRADPSARIRPSPDSDLQSLPSKPWAGADRFCWRARASRLVPSNVGWSGPSVDRWASQSAAVRSCCGASEHLPSNRIMQR
jgi:hypothetical protein